MRNSRKLSLAICLVLVAVVAIVPMLAFTAFAVDTEVVFELGANGSATHKDGSSNTSYSETVSGYTLNITGGTSMYTGAIDAKGNSCIKLGTSSKTGGFSFTVPSDVTKVVINVAGYKATAAKLTINGTSYTTTKVSNNGEYDAITVDTTSTKTVTLTTVSGGLRAMVNSITFVIGSGSSEPACEHTNTTTTTVDATCTENGSTTVTCDECGKIISEETIKAGHSYVNGICTVCGQAEPKTETTTLSFADVANRLSQDSNKQVWTQNGITFTNIKSGSSTAVSSNYNPVRLYAGSSITVDMGGQKIVKIDFVCNSTSYASALKNAIGDDATVNGTTVTVEFANSVENYTVTLGAQVRMNSITVKYEPSGCAHKNTTTNTNQATCTTAGSVVVTCTDCGNDISTTPIPATGHSIVDGACTVCGYLDGTNVPTGDIAGISSTIDFSDKANRVQLDAEMQIWRQNGVVLINNKAESGTNVADYADPVRFYKSSTLTISSAKEIVKINIACNSTAYASDLAASIGDAATVYGKVVVVKLADPVTSYTITLSEKVFVDSLTAFYEEELPAIAEASVTIGKSLAMNYTVTIPLGYDFSDIYMVFTMNNVATTVAEYTETNSGYVFSFTRLAPQCMGDSIKAELYMDGEVVVTYDNFSVKAYAEKLLALNPGDAELATLVADMLNYGAAAQQYVGYKTDALVNAGYETAGSNAEPTESDMTVTESSNANFGIISAGVRFDYVNQIYVKFGIRAAALEGAAPTVVVAFNGVEQTVTLDGEGEYVVYSGAISALEFGKVYTIELKVDGEVVQTLTYSVNSYVFAKKDGNNAMAELALALYRYGNSAVAYSEK